MRFLSRDTAIGEGTVAVRRGPTQLTKAANYSALFVRDDGQWRLAQLREVSPDPATGGIRSWTIEANGGVAEADWRRDGDHWVLDSDGTLPDGRTLKQTNVLRRINNDTITWQSVDRSLGDETIPDLAPVKVTRIKSE